MVVEVFVPSVSIESGIEEIRAQVAVPRLSELRHRFSNGELPVLLQLSDVIKITFCEIRSVVDVLGHPDLCSSRSSVLPSSLHQTQFVFLTLHSSTISAGDVFFKGKNFITLCTSIADHVSINAAIF
ncbi:hypothetical protein AVEN_245807-1 [Araneus ventricosus]|uniref:Uncharacterized protein n=1 Tax=Araneus ventricosus TaxID=182803 RepID=A0A4Y2E8A1_ARAVE|nr:hypothetical protein AVEN_245807-1 [Araneus ventricosus]